MAGDALTPNGGGFVQIVCPQNGACSAFTVWLCAALERASPKDVRVACFSDATNVKRGTYEGTPVAKTQITSVMSIASKP